MTDNMDDLYENYKINIRSGDIFDTPSEPISNNTPASEEIVAYRLKIKNGKIIKENLNEDEN
jgi:hypothetical protein